MEMKPTYFVGLDLGQASDFTALVVLERPVVEQRKGKGVPSAKPVYSLRHLHRFPLGTPYTEIVSDVVTMVGKPPLEGCSLIVDSTGVGAAVMDLLRQSSPKALLRPVLITGGNSAAMSDDGCWHVAKVQLVSVLQILLQARRLKVAPALPLAELLTKELQNFRVKITASANETYEAWREGDHDDLVLSAALACWFAETLGSPGVMTAVPTRSGPDHLGRLSRTSLGRTDRSSGSRSRRWG